MNGCIVKIGLISTLLVVTQEEPLCWVTFCIRNVKSLFAYLH